MPIPKDVEARYAADRRMRDGWVAGRIVIHKARRTRAVLGERSRRKRSQIFDEIWLILLDPPSKGTIKIVDLLSNYELEAAP